MKIGIFSASGPASEIAKNRSQKALHFLQSKGHEVILGSLFYQKNNYRSGTIKERINEFNQLLSLECDIYLSSIGGFCSNSISELIDLSLVKENMVFVGNSDASPILNRIALETKAKVIYGPALISHFGEWEDEYAKQSYEKMMSAIRDEANILTKFDVWTDEYSNWDSFQKPKVKNKNEITFSRKGIITGNLIGGNLNSLSTTTFLKDPEIFQDAILFIEDSHKSLDQIEKLLAMLFVNKVVKGLKAIIFGKYEQIDSKGCQILPHEIFNELIEANKMDKIPMVYYINCGNTHPTNSLILNKKIEINYDLETIIQ